MARNARDLGLRTVTLVMLAALAAAATTTLGEREARAGDATVTVGSDRFAEPPPDSSPPRASAPLVVDDAPPATP